MCNKRSNPDFSRMYSVPNSIDKCKLFHFVHPFTCMVAGMTGSGKISGKIFVATGSKGNQPTTKEDCLVLFAVAARLPRIDGSNTKHRVCQRCSFQSQDNCRL